MCWAEGGIVEVACAAGLQMLCVLSVEVGSLPEKGISLVPKEG